MTEALIAMHDALVAAFEDDTMTDEEENLLNEIEERIHRLAIARDVQIIS